MDTKNKSLPIGTSLLITEHPTLQAKGRLFLCKRCGEFKEYHAKGLCKKCYKKKYHAENKEKESVYAKKRRLKNPERMKVYYKKYRNYALKKAGR